MLTISFDQVDVFRAATLASFEAAMMQRCAELAPRRAPALGEAGLRVAVHAAVERARHHRLTNRGPVRLFVELSALLGSGFDRDVQLPFAARILAGDGPQSDRADELYAHAVAFLKAVGGPGGRHDHDASMRLRALLAAEPAWDEARDLGAALLTTMAATHPERYARVGEPALRSLVARAADEAAARDLHAPADIAVFAGLMFALGEGCFADPFHPWLAAAVDGADPGARLRAEALARL